MIDCENKIKIYERNGSKTDIDAQPLIIRNHWNEDSKVVLYLKGEEITVSAADLKTAIENAINVHRY